MESKQLGNHRIKEERSLHRHMIMTFILAKNKKDLIKALKKTGDDVVLVKCTVVYAFPKGMYKTNKEELKKYPDRFKYYRTRCFVRRIKFKRTKL